MFAKNHNDKLKTICGPLAENLKGFKMSHDQDNMILKGIFQTSVSIVGGFAIRGPLFEPHFCFSELWVHQWFESCLQ